MTANSPPAGEDTGASCCADSACRISRRWSPVSRRNRYPAIGSRSAAALRGENFDGAVSTSVAAPGTLSTPLTNTFSCFAVSRLVLGSSVPALADALWPVGGGNEPSVLSSSTFLPSTFSCANAALPPATKAKLSAAMINGFFMAQTFP